MNPPANSPWSVRCAALTLVLALLAAYANSFSGAFVFDDTPAIVGNPSIRDLTAIDRVLSPPPDEGQTVGGRPVVNLTLALNYAFGGMAPRGYHVVNFVIHALAALTLFGVVRRTLRLPSLAPRFAPVATPLAWAAAALWALHPLQTESVTYVVQRAESLVSLFFLLTLLAFIRGARGLAVVACLVGMATKEVMVSAPLLVLLYDRVFVAGTWREAWVRRGRFHLALASTWLVLAWCVHAAGNRGGTAGLGAGDSSFEYLLIQCRALVHYLRLAAWPSPQVFDYGMVLPPTLAEAVPFALGLMLLLAATVFALRRAPAIGFLGAWFFALLAPSSSLVPIAVQPMAEHRMYLALAAPVVGLVLQVWSRGRAWWPFVPLAIALGLATAARNETYRTPLALWRDTTAKVPGNSRAQAQLAAELAAIGELDAALDHFDLAIHLEEKRPAFARTLLGDYLVNRGNVLLAAGRTDAAVRSYRAAIEQVGEAKLAHFNLGCIALEAGRLAEARAEFEATLRLDPNHVSAHTNLGSVCLREDRTAEAVTQFEAAVRLEPSPKTHANLGLALARAQRTAEALAQFDAALRLDPGFAPARELRAQVTAAVR